MPKLYPIQESFSAGELSPRMLSRTTSKGYKEGLIRAENMISLAQGPSKRRPGFRFVFETPNPAAQCRLIPFPVDADTFYVAIFVPNQLYIVNELGQLIAPEKVLNADFKNGAADWISNPGAGATIVFNLFSATLTSSAARTAVIQQNVTGLTIGVQYRLSVLQLPAADSVRLRVGTTQGGAEVAQVIGGLVTMTLPFTATAVSHWIEVASLTVGAICTVLIVSVQEVLAPIPIATPFSGDLLLTLQYEIDPTNTEMYITSGLQPVQKLVLAGGAFTFGPAVFVAPPAEWVAGNYPRCVTFFQGRLWFGGTANQPSKFWASRSGLYNDFTLGLNADDALAYTIAKRGAIRWMNGSKNLLMGTENTEFVISATNGVQDVITPTDILPEVQSAYGSIFAQPMPLGNVLLFFNGDGRKLYSMGYRFEESGWVSTDLTLASEHITEPRALAAAYAQKPESIVWAILSTGQLIAASYERGNNIIGWHRHPTSMVIRSIATVPFLGTDVVLAAITIQRGGNTFIQVGGLFNVVANSPFQDMWKAVISAGPTVTFPGFQHLADQTVDVLVDGATHPQVLVSPGGVITLQAPASQVIAGFGNLARITSVPFEPGTTPQGTGTAFKRFNKAYVQVSASSRPIINGVRPPDRTPSTPMDTPEPLLTGRFFSVKLGYTLQEVIDIQEPLPINLGVNGLFGELDVEAL